MHFGITFKPDLSVDRIVSLARQAEAAGFTYAWIFDSHVLWKEPFPLLTLMAANTQRMHLGTCVTNPAVRDVTVSASLFATLNLISGGRMELGIGRGDSSRRVLGKRPTTLENLEEFVRNFRALMASQKANQARLKSAVEFGKTEMSDSSELHQSVLRAVLYAMMELVKNVDGSEVLAHLTLNVPDYYANQTQRDLVVELADYLAKQLETLRPDEASAARILRELVRHQRLG